MLDFSVPKTTMYVNPQNFPGLTHVGGISTADFLSALHAIDAEFRADCAALKARYPGKRGAWPPEAVKEAYAIQARFDEAIDELLNAGQEVQS